jgi:hypothetical protein
MSILVVCPSCKKSFQVSEKFAGKTGPCPKCKGTIKVPEKSQEVKIHGGENFSTGGRTVTGQLALKPIARKQTIFKPVMAAAVAGAVVGVVAITLVGRSLGVFGHYWAETLGLLLLSPVLAVTAYTFLRDDELEPYRGIALYIRAGACALIYTVLWGLFIFVKTRAEPGDEIWQWFLIVTPFFALGGMTGWLSLDLEPANGFFHYGFYVLVTTMLGWIAGLGWVWST